MGELVDRIRNHRVWTDLTNLGPVIDRAAQQEGNDAATAEGLHRIRAVLTFCGKRLASIDPFLVQVKPLTNISNALVTAQGELEAFVNDGGTAHVASANSQADNILGYLTSVGSLHAPDDLTFLASHAASYQATLSKYLDEARAKQAEVATLAADNQTRLVALGTTLSEEQSKLSTLTAGYQKEFTDGQTKRTEEFTAAQTDRQTKFASTSAENQAAFTQAQDERAKAFGAVQGDRQKEFTAAQETRAKEHTDAQADRQAKFSALIESYTEKLAEQNGEFTKQRGDAIQAYQAELQNLSGKHEEDAKSILEKIEGYKKEVEKVVGVVGNLAVTSGYLRVANHARWALYVWQTLTVVSLGGLVWVAYLIAFHAPVPGTDFYQGFATRVFLSVAVGVFAAYAAKQAANFWEVERKNRKLALELEALGPYIAPLPPDMQNQFRIDVGGRSFGVPDGVPVKPIDPGPTSALDVVKPRDMVEAIKTAQKLVDDLTKASKAGG